MTLVTQANHCISKFLQKQKIKYSTARLIVGKLLLLVSCPVNAFLKEQRYDHANHQYTALDSTSSFFKKQITHASKNKLKTNSIYCFYYICVRWTKLSQQAIVSWGQAKQFHNYNIIH